MLFTEFLDLIEHFQQLTFSQKARFIKLLTDFEVQIDKDCSELTLLELHDVLLAFLRDIKA